MIGMVWSNYGFFSNNYVFLKLLTRDIENGIFNNSEWSKY